MYQKISEVIMWSKPPSAVLLYVVFHWIFVCLAELNLALLTMIGGSLILGCVAIEFLYFQLDRTDLLCQKTIKFRAKKLSSFEVVYLWISEGWILLDILVIVLMHFMHFVSESSYDLVFLFSIKSTIILFSSLFPAVILQYLGKQALTATLIYNLVAQQLIWPYNILEVFSGLKKETMHLLQAIFSRKEKYALTLVSPLSLSMMDFLSHPDKFPSNLKNGIGMSVDNKSTATSKHFYRLALCFEMVIPDLLVRPDLHHKSAKGLQEIMTHVIMMTDQESLQIFFQTYSQDINYTISILPSNSSWHHKKLANYLEKDFCKNLRLASCLDVKKLVKSLKKGILPRLEKLSQKLQCEISKDKFSHVLTEKFRSYEWVYKLMSTRGDIATFLDIRKERPLFDIEKEKLKQLIGAVELSDEQTKSALNQLEFYGVVRCKEKDQFGYPTYIIEAANLSLFDILAHQADWSDADKSIEVLILCKECFYIDASLYYRKCKIKNVTIFASKVIVVQDKQVIDVSGSDGKSYDVCSRASDGKVSSEYGPGAHGDNGEHGEPGESGGNIMICADEIVNSELLVLCSKGGCGGNGQHGGNGQNGRAKPSYSDDLDLFMKKKPQLVRNNLKKAFEENYKNLTFLSSKSLFSAYGTSSDEVQILHGSKFTNFLGCYAFLYSRGVNGESANGGNAGRGGKAGGGGKGGRIKILMKNMDRNYDHDITIISIDGCKGTAGKPGKPGKRALAESRRDYLVVDGLAKSVLKYDGFINVHPYTGIDPSRLNRGWYSCDHKVSQCLDSVIDSDKIEFFMVKRNTYCPTKYNQQAENGKEQQQQDEVIHSTPTRAISVSDFLICLNEFLQFQSSFQLLNEMQQTITEKLGELQSDSTKDHYKQIRKQNSLSANNSAVVIDFDVQSILKLKVNFKEKKSLPFKEIADCCNKIEAMIISTRKEPGELKLNIIRFKKSTVQKQYQILEEYVEDKLSRLTFGSVCKDDYTVIYTLLKFLINPTFLVHIDRNTSVQTLHCILENSLFLFESNAQYMQIKHNITLRYQWSMLAQAHQQLVDEYTYSDTEFQRKSIYIFYKITSQKSVSKIKDKYAKWFAKLTSFKGVLKPLEHIDSADSLPLTMETNFALKTLMVFIREANEKRCLFPDILGAIRREYDAYCSTITNPDLIFIIIYIQKKLCNLLLERQHLEALFCKRYPLTKEDVFSYRDGFILYKEETYQIQSMDICLNTIVIVASNNNIFKVKFDENFEVLLNEKVIVFPEALLFSRLNILLIWEKIQSFLRHEIDNIEELNKLLKAHNIQSEDLILLLEKVKLAEMVQFDIFSFYPPSRWVEKLILFTVHKQYDDCDPHFVVEIEKKIEGLSMCYDKCLYYTLYVNFLLENSQRGDSFKFELLEVLGKMHYIFIERKLCFLVTTQGLRQAGISNADIIFKNLVAFGIIDFIGMFFQHATESTIENFCESQSINDSFYLKTCFTMQANIAELSTKELSFWNCKLGELRLRLSLKQLAGKDNNLCDTLLAHTYQMNTHYGDCEVLEFIQSLCHLSQKDISKEQLLDLFSKCSSKEWYFPIVTKHIYDHAEEGNHDFSFLQKLEDFKWESFRDEERSVKNITEHIKSHYSLNSGAEHLSSILDIIEESIINIKLKENNVSDFYSDRIESRQVSLQPIKLYSKDDIYKWVGHLQKHNVTISTHVVEVFAVIRRGITLFYETKKNTQGVKPRDAQMVASLLFLHSLSAQGDAHGTKLLQQILTGEGKTMILCMVAIYKVLTGEKVDIVTSSSVLATRDAIDLKPLYDMFKISVSHCCHEALVSRCKSYEADVVYGDIGSFQRDILETDFYDRDIRTDRGYKNIFVDEVDSMLVDKGQNMLYLPHVLPDMNCLEELYLVIWSSVNAKGFIGLPHEKEQLCFLLKQIIFGAIAPSTFESISEVNEGWSAKIFSGLLKSGIIDSEDHCLAITDVAMIKGCVEKFESSAHVRNDIIAILKKKMEEKPLIQKIPKSLHPFIKKSLKPWIHSAVCAKYFRPEKEYIIDIDRRESASDPYPKIVIMDNDTGVEQESSEWGSGLHQFLQLKHNLRLSAESLKAVYMSNITFFTKLYKNVMGVTGTLGSVAEHRLFKRLYDDILIVKLPTNKPSRLRMEMPMCYSKKVEWEEAIFKNVSAKLQENRVVLLICEDVEGARHLQQYLNIKNKHLNSVLYVSSHDDKLEERTAFNPGQLIIATNLAGRGTDIRLSEEVKKNGGLHVCLSYLPLNTRVEMQAYGRAARSGNPGSCIMIFYSKERDMSAAIQKRNLLEGNRVAGIEADYFNNIKFQEELFYMFRVSYDIVAKEFKAEYRAIMDHCLDCWAFFLDHYMDIIESIPSKLPHEVVSVKHKITQAFETEIKVKLHALKNYTSDVLPLSSSRLMQLGHVFMRRELKSGKGFKKAKNKTNFNLAVQFYKQALSSDPDPFIQYYLAAAMFNQSFSQKNTSIKPGKEERRSLKRTFYKIMPLFETKIKQCHENELMLHVANRHQDQTIAGKINYFQEQKQHEIEVYQHFIHSMQAIVGNEITPQMFNHADWGEEERRVIFEIVRKQFALKNPHIAKHYKKRLKRMLSNCDLYYTYESRISDKVNLLSDRNSVSRDCFTGLLPDKEELWSLLKKYYIVVSKDGMKLEQNELIGYWNPIIDIDTVELGAFDCITARSFDWIEECSSDEKKAIHDELIKRNILSHRGRLLESNFSKIDLPDMCVKHYKAIKETLWHHTIYRFILDHLRDSAEIDADKEISDSEASNAFIITNSVVEFLINCLHPSTVTNSRSQFPTPISESKIDSDNMFMNLESGTLSKDYVKSDAVSEELNLKFVDRMRENDVTVTEVYGSGLISMINAMIQHAKREYFSPKFEKAYDIYKHIELEYSSTDISDTDLCASLAEIVLKKVNCIYSSKIGKVSFFQASIDRPVFYSVSDCNFPLEEHKHVAIWQHGNHYAAIVHHHEVVDSMYHESSNSAKIMESQMKISKALLQKLKKLNILRKSKGIGKYCISKPLHKINFELDQACSLSPQEKKVAIAFLTFKLEVDFKTLANSPRLPASNPSQNLFDDLCQYSVIKTAKIKMTRQEIDDRCQKMKFSDLPPFTSLNDVLNLLAGKKICYLKLVILNMFLEWNGVEGLSPDKFKKLKTILSSRKATSIIFRANVNGNIESAISDIGPDIDAVVGKHQREHVKSFVLLMLKVRKNASFIVSTLKKNASALLNLETPQISLRKLCDLFDSHTQDRGDVLGWFSDSHHDLMISLGEEMWSWKTISTTSTVIAIGAAQLILGVVLQVATTGIASSICGTLICEGISDLMFGIEGLVRGHCNWSQYFKSKTWSLLFSLATVGIGSVINVSKHGFKMFHSIGQGVGALEAGKTATKILAKSIGLKIAKKAAEAATNVALTYACERLSENLSQSVEGLRQFILSSFDGITTDFEFNRKITAFLVKQDPEVVEEILHQIFTSVLQHQSFFEFWDGIASTMHRISAQTVHDASRLIESKGLFLCEQSVRLAPLLTETMKNKLVRKKMILIKKEIMLKVDQHQSSEVHISHVDKKVCEEMLRREIQKTRQILSEEFRGHEKNSTELGISAIDEMLLDEVRCYGQEMHRDIKTLKEGIDLHQLKRCEFVRISKKSNSLVVCYEESLTGLSSITHSPNIVAQLIEHHNAQPNPKLLLPILEKRISRPIKLFNDKGVPIFIEHSYKGHNDPLHVVFNLKKKHFCVNGEVFIAEKYGNDCLIHSVLKGASKYKVQDIRKELAKACKTRSHICNAYIRYGVVRNCVTMNLTHTRDSMEGAKHYQP